MEVRISYMSITMQDNKTWFHKVSEGSSMYKLVQSEMVREAFLHASIEAIFHSQIVEICDSQSTLH